MCEWSIADPLYTLCKCLPIPLIISVCFMVGLPNTAVMSTSLLIIVLVTLSCSSFDLDREVTTS